MDISFPRVESYIRAPSPVEFIVIVDHRTIRAAIEWSSMLHLIGSENIHDDSVRNFIRKNRDGIELAIKAHLFAQGVPLAGQFVLTLNELKMCIPSGAAVGANSSD